MQDSGAARGRSESVETTLDMTVDRPRGSTRHSGEFPVALFANSMVMGGMEEHLAQLAVGLVRRGHRVGVLCSPRAEIEPLRQRLRTAGASVHAIAERGTSRGGGVRRLFALRSALRAYSQGVLHLHVTGYAGGELVTLAAILAGITTIVRTEHLPPVVPITPLGRLVLFARDRFLSRIICVSDQNRREHLDRLGRDPRKFVVVPNGVDIDRFVASSVGDGVWQEFGIDESAPIVGTVARLGERRKGISHFLEMAAAVRAAHPEARFLIVGDGPLRRELEIEANALGLGGAVIFTGERTDIPRLLAAMRVFVVPSLYEGAAYTLLEAMAAARPVVTTMVGLAPELIEHGVNGLLVPSGNSAALASAVRVLLANENLAARLGRRARERVIADFSEEAMIEKILRVYRDVIEPRRSLIFH